MFFLKINILCQSIYTHFFLKLNICISHFYSLISKENIYVLIKAYISHCYIYMYMFI